MQHKEKPFLGLCFEVIVSQKNAVGEFSYCVFLALKFSEYPPDKIFPLPCSGKRRHYFSSKAAIFTEPSMPDINSALPFL